MADTFATRARLEVGGKSYAYASLPKLGERFDLAGLTRTLSAGVEAGAPYLDCNFAGTSTAAGYCVVMPEQVGAAAASSYAAPISDATGFDAGFDDGDLDVPDFLK